MNKLIKTEVLTVYISQFLLLLVITFCNAIPLWSETIFITGGKSILGFLVVIVICFINIWFFFKKFWRFYARLPVKYMLESLLGLMYSIDLNCNKGKFTPEETEACKERLNDSMKWLNIYDRLALPLIIFDAVSVCASVFFIAIKLIKINTFCFSAYYGVSGFFVIIQSGCLFISSRFLFSSVQSWVNKMMKL